MTLTSKYNMGDTIYTISNHTHSLVLECNECEGQSANCMQAWAKCSTCHNTGKITKRSPLIWTADTEGFTIGMIRCEIGYKDEVEYMCRETGIGSGNVYNEERIYATFDDAVTECNKRNKAKEDLTLSLHDVLGDCQEKMQHE